MSYTDAMEFIGDDDFKAFRAWCYEGSCIQQRMGLFDEPPTFWVKLKPIVDRLLTYKQANLALTDPKYFKSLLIDLSQLKWLKNVRHPTDGCWAYTHNHMQIPEARVFCLNWKSKNDRKNAQQPQKGDLIALVQQAKVTHIVEVLDDEIYDSNHNEWGAYYRVVKAVWMPTENFDWNNLKNTKEIFGTSHLPQKGSVYNFENMAWFKINWRDSEGLQGFQQYASKNFIE
jgi:hypothetical protein